MGRTCRSSLAKLRPQRSRLKALSKQTTTTLKSNAPTTELSYSQEFTLTAEVQSPIAGSVYGSFWRFIDGVRQEYTLSGPPFYWYLNSLSPGTHTFYVQYEGNNVQPPSVSRGGSPSRLSARAS